MNNWNLKGRRKDYIILLRPGIDVLGVTNTQL